MVFRRLLGDFRKIQLKKQVEILTQRSQKQIRRYVTPLIWFRFFFQNLRVLGILGLRTILMLCVFLNSNQNFGAQCPAGISRSHNEKSLHIEI